MLLLTTGHAGPQVVSEIVPDGMTVGYGGFQGGPMHAAISIEYPHRALPAMTAAFRCARDLKQDPIVAVFDNDIQVSFSISPIPEWCRKTLLPGMMAEAADDLKAIHVTSFADIDQHDESFTKFLEYFERDKFFVVALHALGGQNRPLDMLRCHELKREIQTFS